MRMMAAPALNAQMHAIVHATVTPAPRCAMSVRMHQCSPAFAKLSRAPFHQGGLP
jgi:hypothetical protein